MVQVLIGKGHFRVDGHALYADYGHDIVCAGISAIIIGGLNALYHFNASEDSIVVQDASVAVDYSGYEAKLKHVIETMIIQLQTIEAQYPEYIKIVNGGV